MVTTIESDRLSKPELIVDDIESKPMENPQSMRAGNEDINLLSPIPNNILIGVLKDRRLKVNKPIKVNFSNKEEVVIAKADEFGEYGFGANRSEALYDLQSTLTELYFTLETDRDNLGNDLELLRQKLHKYISCYEKP